MSHSFFSTRYFDAIQEASIRSANVCLSMLFERFQPSCVVDVGCGTGAWLAVCKERGVDRILGLDGTYVDVKSLLIPQADFKPMDLAHLTLVDGAFDMAISLEAAQYLPAHTAQGFVDFLVDLPPTVLFSSAHPGQPGDHHLNAQWLDYWCEHFSTRGYVAIDFARSHIWHDERVAMHYRQNMALFVKETVLEGSPSHALLRTLPKVNCLTLVDMDTLKSITGLKHTLSRLPSLIKRRLTR